MASVLTTGRLAMAPLVVLQWVIAWWSFRLLPTTIKTEIMKDVAWISISAAWFGTVLAEIVLYRYMTGIRALDQDNFFTDFLLGEMLVSFCLFFISGKAWQRKRDRAKKEEDAKT